MKRIRILIISILTVFWLCGCNRSEVSNRLLGDLGIENINSCTVLYDDNGKEVSIDDTEDISFLEDYVYAYNLPIERTHEIFLFPSTKSLRIEATGKTVEIVLLANGEIITGRDEEGNYRVYQTKEPQNASRKSFGKIIKKYGGYIDESIE